MISENTKELRNHFGDEKLLSWCNKYGCAPIYLATAGKQIIRELIVAMLCEGMSHQEVSDESGASLSHVYTTYKRWREGRPL